MSDNSSPTNSPTSSGSDGSNKSGRAARKAKDEGRSVTHTSHACDVCRQRKVRCDGNPNSGMGCSNCVRQNVQCSFMGLDMRRPADRMVAQQGQYQQGYGGPQGNMQGGYPSQYGGYAQAPGYGTPGGSQQQWQGQQQPGYGAQGGYPGGPKGQPPYGRGGPAQGGPQGAPPQGAGRGQPPAGFQFNNGAGFPPGQYFGGEFYGPGGSNYNNGQQRR